MITDAQVTTALCRLFECEPHGLGQHWPKKMRETLEGYEADKCQTPDAYRAGAEMMRERAAQEVDASSDDDDEAVAQFAADIAAAIRALPVE